MALGPLTAREGAKSGNHVPDRAVFLPPPLGEGKTKVPRGFTLIEVMIVVAVIAILMAIAVPSYQSYVMRAQRANAKAALLQAAQWMERTATAQGKYETTLAAGLSAVEGDRYTVVLSNATATTYKLTATRKNPGANANDKCGDFTLTEAGVRGLTGTPAPTLSVTECWGR